MKLLFDQNLSSALPGRLAHYFPDSLHLKSIGMMRASDSEVWNYAKSNGFCIVSKDSDYYQLSMLYGVPPKVLWLRVGNCSTAQIESLMLNRHSAIVSFGDDALESILVLQ
jgi:predicted nuclease of predicted toxin-antitoxin system